MFPTVEEYQTALLTSREGPLRSLRLEPVLTATGEVEQETGSYSVVFRMRSIDDPGQEWAMKCYVADQERRLTSCRAIIEYLTSISSPYLLPLHLYENECYCQGQYYPIVLLPWVEGDSLVNYVRKWIDAPERLEKLSHDFGFFACWLRRQSFAHGDLKSDNLRIRPRGELVLLDYDGLYIPTMQGEPPREEGNPDYTHPLYQSTDFNEHAGDFALSVIALSLRALVLSPTLFRDFGGDRHLLLQAKDFIYPEKSKALQALSTLPYDPYFKRLEQLFREALERRNLAHTTPERFLPL